MMALISNILALFIMVGVGYYSAKKGFISVKLNRELAVLLIQVIFPIAMINNGYQNFQEEGVLSTAAFLIIPLCLIVIGYAVVSVVVHYMPLEDEKKGIFKASCIFSNTIFIGLPMAITLLGERSATYVMLYYVCNTCLFWIIGVRGFVKKKPEDKKSIGQFFPMPVRGFLCGVVLALLGVKIPAFIRIPISNIGYAATPLSMMYIGAMVCFTDYKSIKMDRHIGGVMLGKLLIYPVFVAFILKYVPGFNAVPSIAAATFTLLAAMPVINQLPIVAGQYHIEEEYANTVGILTTACAVVWVPIIGAIIKMIFRI